MLTLLTPTGDRPEAFDLCKKWISKQDYKKPIKWIIVNDGIDELEVENTNNITIQYIKLPPRQPNTQSINLLEGLNYVSEDAKLVIIEDDDYYGVEWLSTVDKYLNDYDLVGEKDTIFFNVKSKSYNKNKHDKHASLCATAMKGKALLWFREVCLNNIEWIDHRLWKDFKGSKLLLDTDIVIGIKGMPGRGGISIGHDNRRFGKYDCDYKHLTQYLNQDVDYYRR